MKLRSLCLTMLEVVVALGFVRGQPSSDSSRFEVASIRQNVNDTPAPRPPFQPGGRFTAGNATLHALIEQAYQLHDFQVVGGPQWTARDRWDIVAKAPGNPPHTIETTAAMRVMLQSLLADRFGLRVHIESRTHAVYDLVLARKDGRLGPKLTRAPRSCGGPFPERPCGFRRVSLGGEIRLESASMALLVSSLGPFVERIVVDRTGLKGNFDAELSWNPEAREPLGADSPAGGVWSEKPGIYTAIQEQLGLKLQSVNGPVNILVIDAAVRPRVEF